MTKKRPLLRELNAQAYADPTPLPETPQKAPTAKRAAPQRKKKTKTTTEEKINIGIYIQRETWDAGRSAFLCDYQDGVGNATAYKEWVDAALHAHAARTFTQRQNAVSEAPERPQGREAQQGVKRSVLVSVESIRAIDKALDEDRAQHSVWQTANDFRVDAINVAAHRTRTRRGGTLPPAPKRLPILTRDK